MKKIIMLLLVLSASFANAQAFKGKGDIKFQVGANLQKWGTGITASTDFGLGENMSYGFVASYLLNTTIVDDVKAKFEDRADIKVRFNANLGNVLKLGDNVDVYPGLNLGTRNFGAHVGARYFFTNGFGVYTEAGVPLAKYKTNPSGFDYLNNQFVVTLGASFNL